VAATNRVEGRGEREVARPAARAALTLILLFASTAGAARAQPDGVTIVPVFEAVGRFADTARHVVSAVERARLYQQLVADAHPECVAQPRRDNRAGADEDPAALSARVEAMSAAPALVRRGISRARAALPGPPVVACLGLARPGRVMRELGGISGFAGPDGVMHLFVEPMVQGWADVLPFTVAHEYHHLAMFARGPQRGVRTVLSRLVFEGKADVFASRLYPAVQRPWHASYSADNERRCWPVLRERLQEPANTAEFTNDYMIAWTGRAPRFCGYYAGRRLVLAYLAARPDLSPERWSAASPQEILAVAGRELR
jgi:hypothetical protein